MLAQTSESVLHAITPATCDDKFYPGATNTEAQCFAAITDNRFTLSLPSTQQGSTSQLIFNPAQGLSDIILTATLPPLTGTLYTGYAFPKNWLNAMINTMALRVGGSSLYYWSSDQLLIDTLSECENGTKQEAYVLAGGVPLSASGASGTTAFPTDAASPLLSASLYVKMPFNSISALQKTLPLNTDLNHAAAAA